MKKRAVLLLLVSLFCQSPILAQSDADRSFARSQRLFAKSKYKKGAKHLQKALEKDSTHEEALLARGSYLAYGGFYELAISDFSRVIKQNPLSFNAYLWRSNAFAKMNLRDSAIKDANSAISVEALSPFGYEQKATVLQQFKQYKAAKKYYRKCLCLDSTLIYPKFQIGVYQMDLLQFDSSIVLFKKLWRQDSSNWSFLANAGYSCMMTNRLEEANDYFDRVINRLPNHSFAICNKGYTQYQLGNKEEGLQLIGTSLSLTPDNSYAFYYLALIYLEEGKDLLSCSCMNTALELGFTRNYGKDVLKIYLEHCN